MILFDLFKKKDKTISANNVVSTSENTTDFNIEYLPISDTKTMIKSVKVTPGIQQHYWQCYVTLEFDNDEWTMLITDTYARDRYNDEEVSLRIKLPNLFPYIPPNDLTMFLNATRLGGPGYNGHRDIKPSEISPLIQEALSIQSKRTTDKTICIDKIYAFNNGYADCACFILFNNKKHYYYFKETGNNKGYCMGTKVYQIDESSYDKYKTGNYNRDLALNFILELPAGDWDWLSDERLLNILVQISSNKFEP